MANYVLVHGAYQGGWIWKPVVERLRAAGHVVHAPTLDGCAERHAQIRPGITLATHAQEIAQFLRFEPVQRSREQNGLVVSAGSYLDGPVRSFNFEVENGSPIDEPCVGVRSWSEDAVGIQDQVSTAKEQPEVFERREKVQQSHYSGKQ